MWGNVLHVSGIPLPLHLVQKERELRNKHFTKQTKKLFQISPLETCDIKRHEEKERENV